MSLSVAGSRALAPSVLQKFSVRWFLGAYVKMRKATVSFVMSVRPLSRKFKFYLNLTRITGALHEDVFTIVTISQRMFLRMRTISAKFVEKIKTLILCKISPPPLPRENRTVYESCRKVWWSQSGHR